MKAKIHPQYYDDAVVTCACGHTFTTGSTKPQIHVDICSACHPLFTGEMKYIDTMGRVERFEKMRHAAQTNTSPKKTKKAKVEVSEEQPLTLKEMIERERTKAKQPLAS